MDVRRCPNLMHNGAPCHRTRTLKGYVRVTQIQVLDWSSNSPDLNPVENLVFCEKLNHREATTSSTELVEALRHVWRREISQAYRQTLVHSMPKRIAVVIKKNERLDKILTILQ